MDAALPASATAKQRPGREAIVLCCKSAGCFGPQLAAVNARPLLLTTQLMYPGGFILHAALDGRTRGESPGAIHDRAGFSYARNQRISVKAAHGVLMSITAKPARQWITKTWQSLPRRCILLPSCKKSAQ